MKKELNSSHYKNLYLCTCTGALDQELKIPYWKVSESAGQLLKNRICIINNLNINVIISGYHNPHLIFALTTKSSPSSLFLCEQLTGHEKQGACLPSLSNRNLL